MDIGAKMHPATCHTTTQSANSSNVTHHQATGKSRPDTPTETTTTTTIQHQTNGSVQQIGSEQPKSSITVLEPAPASVLSNLVEPTPSILLHHHHQQHHQQPQLDQDSTMLQQPNQIQQQQQPQPLLHQLQPATNRNNLNEITNEPQQPMNQFDPHQHHHETTNQTQGIDQMHMMNMAIDRPANEAATQRNQATNNETPASKSNFSSATLSGANKRPQQQQQQQHYHHHHQHHHQHQHHQIDGIVADGGGPIVQWLLDNYEIADGESLPRSTVYNHYLAHCRQLQMSSVNAASFGKLIRSVFVGLKTRRLGTRGHSKYHYFGVRAKQHVRFDWMHEQQQDLAGSSGGASQHHSIAVQQQHHHHQQQQQQPLLGNTTNSSQNTDNGSDSDSNTGDCNQFHSYNSMQSASQTPTSINQSSHIPNKRLRTSTGDDTQEHGAYENQQPPAVSSFGSVAERQHQNHHSQHLGLEHIHSQQNNDQHQVLTFGQNQIGSHSYYQPNGIMFESTAIEYDCVHKQLPASSFVQLETQGQPPVSHLMANPTTPAIVQAEQQHQTPASQPTIWFVNNCDLSSLRQHLGPDWNSLVDANWPAPDNTVDLEPNEGYSLGSLFESQYKAHYRRMIELLSEFKFDDIQHLMLDFWQNNQHNQSNQSFSKDQLQLNSSSWTASQQENHSTSNQENEKNRAEDSNNNNNNNKQISSNDQFDGQQQTLTFIQLYHMIDCSTVVQRISQIDYCIFEAIGNFLLPDILRPIPRQLAHLVRAFAKNIELWTELANKNYPAEFIGERLKSAHAFSCTIQRYLSINRLSTASLAIWNKRPALDQMSMDLSQVDLRDIEHQVSLMDCERVAVVEVTYKTNNEAEQQSGERNSDQNYLLCRPPLCREKKHSIQAAEMIQDFLHLLENLYPANDWPQWCRNLVDKCISGQSEAEAWNFILRWNFFISVLMKELTLKSAVSLSSFQLIRLLFDEYLCYLVVVRLARYQNKTIAQIFRPPRSESPSNCICSTS